jgi:hypothetical protein
MTRRTTTGFIVLFMLTTTVALAAPAPVPAKLVRPASPPAAPLPLRQVGWGAGEGITYTIKIAGVEGARGAISVGKPTVLAGQRTLKLRVMGETVPFFSKIRRMREETVTQVDLAGLLPVHSFQDRQVPGNTRTVDATFAPQVRLVIRWIDRPQPEERKRARSRPHDAMSLLYTLRSALPPAHSRFNVILLSGMTLYRLALEVKQRERVYIPNRPPADAWRIDGTATPINDDGSAIKEDPVRRLTLWLGDDVARTPLKVQGETRFGWVEAVLTSYRQPRGRLTLRVAPLTR